MTKLLYGWVAQVVAAWQDVEVAVKEMMEELASLLQAWHPIWLKE